MSAVDRAWLRMDTPQNPMMICAVLILEQPVPMPRLRQLLEERFLRFRRFRQRIVEKNGKTWWQDDSLFDLDNHLHCIALPGRGTQKELQELAGDLNSTALDFRRPLWQIHYIDGYNGGCALLVRIHHCIADGISLVRVLLSLTDQNPDSAPPAAASAAGDNPPVYPATPAPAHHRHAANRRGTEPAAVLLGPPRPCLPPETGCHRRRHRHGCSQAGPFPF